jgi:flagellar hook assembly protein FlgD
MALTVSAPESGSLTIRIYDAFGKLVNTIHNGNVSTGTVNATWNTMDMNGTLVAAGSYIVRVEGAGVSTSKVVSVVR